MLWQSGAAIGVSLLAGAWNGLLVGAFGIQPIVATLILMVAGRGVAQLITDGQIITFHDERLTFLCNGHFLGAPFPVWIVAVMFLLTALWTRKTAWGLFIECVGDNERASYFTGINSRWVKFVVYTFSGLCAGIAGLARGLEHQRGRRQPCWIVFGVGRDRGRRRRRHGPHRRAVLSAGLRHRRDHHSNADDDDVCAERQLRCCAGAQGARDPGSLPVAIANLPPADGSIGKAIAGIGSGGRRETPLEIHSFVGDDGRIRGLVLLRLRESTISARCTVAVDLFGDNGFLGVAAVGATFVILSGGIDLSVGAVVAATSILIASLIESGVHPVVAILIASLRRLLWRFDGFDYPFLPTAAVHDHLGRHVFSAGLGFVIRPQSLGIKHPFYDEFIIDKLAIPLTAKSASRLRPLRF